MSGNPNLDPDLLAEIERLRAEVTALKKGKRNVQLSVESDDWGSPVALIEAARRVLGGFDLDPFSSDYWNYWTVKAACYYTAADNGLVMPWSGRLIVNPPSGVIPGTRRSIVRAAWERLVKLWLEGEVESAIWVGYSLEQLPILQNAPMHPLQFWTVVPRERQEFLERTEGNGPPRPGTAPTHGNYVTFLHSRDSREVAHDQALRFREEANRLSGIGGALVRPL